MIKILKEALDQVAALPEADQEQIGRELLEELDMDSVIRRAHCLL